MLGHSVAPNIAERSTGDVELGYARNKGLAVAIANFPVLNGTFDYWSAGGHLTHPMGTDAAGNFRVSVSVPELECNVLYGINCGGSYTRNLISVGLAWRARPRAF